MCRFKLVFKIAPSGMSCHFDVYHCIVRLTLAWLTLPPHPPYPLTHPTTSPTLPPHPPHSPYHLTHPTTSLTLPPHSSFYPGETLALLFTVDPPSILTYASVVEAGAETAAPRTLHWHRHRRLLRNDNCRLLRRIRHSSTMLQLEKKLRMLY